MTSLAPPKVRGHQRWVQLVAVGLIIVTTQALPTYGGALLIPQMAKGLGFSRTAVGAIFSSFMISMGALSFASGALINRFGARAAFSFGSGLLAIGASLVAQLRLSWEESAVLIGALVGGATAIGGAIPAVTHVSRWFTDRRALAMTFIFCMMSLGGALGVGVLSAVDGVHQDWRAGWRVVALCAVASLVLALMVVRDGPDPRLAQAIARGPAAAKPDRGSPDLSTRQSIRSRLFLMLMLSATGAFISAGLLTGHGLLNLLDLGVPAPKAASVIAAFPLAALAGKFLIGLIGDRVDTRISAGVATLACGLGLIAMPFSSAYVLALVSAGLIGLGFGGSIVCTPLVLVDAFGKVPLTSLTSTIQGVQTIVGAVATFLTGMAFDAGAGYARLFTAAGVFCCLVGMALVIVAPPRTAATSS